MLGTLMLDVGADRHVDNKPSPLVGISKSEIYSPEVCKQDMWEKRNMELVSRLPGEQGKRVKGKGVRVHSACVDERKKVRDVYTRSGVQQLKKRAQAQHHAARVKAHLVSNVEFDPNLLFHVK